VESKQPVETLAESVSWGPHKNSGRRAFVSARAAERGSATCNNTSTQKPVNSRRMTKQQLIEKVAAKTELKKAEV
jgi:hypothetical protein